MLKFRETQITPHAEMLDVGQLINAVTSGRISLTEPVDAALKAARVRLADELEVIAERHKTFSSIEETLKAIRALRNSLVERLQHYHKLYYNRPENLTKDSPIVEHARERIAAIDVIFIQVQPELEKLAALSTAFLKFPRE